MTIRQRLTKLEEAYSGGLRIILRRNLRQALKERPRKKGDKVIVLPAYAEKL